MAHIRITDLPMQHDLSPDEQQELHGGAEPAHGVFRPAEFRPAEFRDGLAAGLAAPRGTASSYDPGFIGGVFVAT